MKKVAFFVDWDNLRKIIQKVKKRSYSTDTPFKEFNFNNPAHISKVFQMFLQSNEEYYRIFFYTAKPLKDDDIKNQLRKATDITAYEKYLEGIGEADKIYNIANTFLREMAKEDYIALRMGKMQVRGMHSGKPDIVQKQVDMLIGLDISEISYNKHADKIIVFSKDTDMIPALKTARINGLTVTLANFLEDNHISHDLKVHCDTIKTINFHDINNAIKGNS